MYNENKDSRQFKASCRLCYWFIDAAPIRAPISFSEAKLRKHLAIQNTQNRLTAVTAYLLVIDPHQKFTPQNCPAKLSTGGIPILWAGLISAQATQKGGSEVLSAHVLIRGWAKEIAGCLKRY